MEDFILREIDKIGTLLRALLERAGMLVHSDDPGEMLAVVRTELLEGLGTELDALLDDPDPGRRLAERHGFREEHLEQFARLLFELVAAEPQRTERCRMARAIAAIHRYLDERRAPVSFDRYRILAALNEYLE